MATTALPGTEHHPHAQAVLGAALADGGRPSHAYLFHGPGGTGKRTAARAFAAELLVEGSRDEAGARARVEHGAHPDLTWVAPTGAHEMRVEDVAGPVVAAASRTPFESSRRVFVLEAAETMNDQAANRLLKTLEEPASYVHLLLLSDRPQELLATIASRCQRVRFDPLPATEIERRLAAAGVDPETAAACARLALGDGRRAHALATGDGPALRAEAERFARAALSGEVADRPWDALLKRARTAGDAAATAVEEGLADQLELAAKRDHKRVETEFAERAKRAGRRAHTEALDLQLELAGLWYRDVAAVADEAADLALSSDRLDELAADAEGRDAVIFREALDLVEDTRRRLALNVSEDLACEALAYRLERALSATAASRNARRSGRAAARARAGRSSGSG